MITWSPSPAPGSMRSRLVRLIGRPRGAARLAGLAVGAPSAIPFVIGIASFGPTPPRDPACFEYCDGGVALGRFLFVIGLIGVLLAIAIWRRHVAAMAIALCVTATAMWTLLLADVWISIANRPAVPAALLAATAPVVVVTVLLALALASEALAAARAAGARAVPVTTAEARLTGPGS